MKIIILLAALVASVAAKASFLADLDVRSFKSPSTFYGKVDGRSVDLEFERSCTDDGKGKADDFVPDSRGIPDSAQRFRQCKFYRVPAPQGPTNSCVTDVDLCQGGFSIVSEVKPERPTQDGGSFSWLLQFGFGKDADFGIRIGFQNAQVVVRVITSYRISHIECNLEPAVEDWYTLTVSRGPRVNGDINIFQNKERLTDCPTQFRKNRPKGEGPPSVKRSEIVLGAAKKNDNINPIDKRYAGDLGQVCFFKEPSSGVQRNTAINKGCFAVP